MKNTVFLRIGSAWLFAIITWISIIFMTLALAKLYQRRIDHATLKVFTWGGLIDPACVKVFEKETGITVKLSYYSTNEELLATLRATGGKGYDIIMPSDYAVRILAQRNLLKRLDHTQLPILDSLDPLFKPFKIDPEFTYSLPYACEIFGFGVNRRYATCYNKEHLNEQTVRWGMIFTDLSTSISHKQDKLIMVNDPLEAVALAAYYLYGPRDDISTDQMGHVKHLLSTQKKWVEAYTDFRPDYFLITGTSPLAVASSSYILRSMRQYPYLDFIIPQEGTFVTLENIAMTAASEHEDLAYKFINFLYRSSIMAHNVRTFAFLPTTHDVLVLLDDEHEIMHLLSYMHNNQEKLHLFRPLASEEQLNDLWVAIKSS